MYGRKGSFGRGHLYKYESMDFVNSTFRKHGYFLNMITNMTKGSDPTWELITIEVVHFSKRGMDGTGWGGPKF